MILIINVVPQIFNRFTERLDGYGINYQAHISNRQLRIEGVRKFLFSSLETTEYMIHFENNIFTEIQKDNIVAFEIKP